MEDKYAIVAPMRHPSGPDDTECGIPLVSAIVEQSKRKARILTAEEELAQQPVMFSKINHVAQQRLHERRRGSPLDTDACCHDPTKELEPTVLISFQSNVPIGGKTSFAVPHCMSHTVGRLRAALIQQCCSSAQSPQQRPPTGPVTIHRSDNGEPLPLEATLIDLGFRFPPLLRVHGFYHEVYLVCAEPLGVRVSVPWSPSLTVTDLLEQVHHRLAPRDLRHVRLRRWPGHSGRKDNDTAARDFLDTERCFIAAAPPYVAPQATLHDLHFCASLEDPVSLTFLRPKDGLGWLYVLPFTGQWTIADVSSFLVAQICEAADGGEGYLATPQPLLAKSPSGLPPNAPFDDDDEEVRFEGSDGSPGEEGRGYRGIFLWSRAEVEDVYGAATAAACGGHVVSMCPPPCACPDVRLPMRFVHINEDFLIPHLSDLRILPGDEVLVEFYDPMSGRWSGDLSHAVTRLLPAAWDDAQHTLFPNHELLSIRSVRDGSIVRVPCTPTTTMESILWMYFMATGHLPMFGELLSDNGNVLAPFQTLASANLLPQTTLFYLHRRRQWLREGVPNLSNAGALRNSQLYAGAPSPSF